MNFLKSLFFSIILLFFSINIFSINDIKKETYDFSKINNINYKIVENLHYDFGNENFQQIKSFIIKPYFLISKDTNTQKIKSVISNFPNELQNNQLKYKIDNLKKLNIININYSFNKKIVDSKIYKKVDFPIKNLDENKFKEELEFTNFITINEDLKFQASKLAENKNDIFQISYDIANWVEKNIKYNLSSILEKPNRDSVKVFYDKTGVCREIILLYTSLLRSLKIPTRIVSGISYTQNKEIVNLVGSNWGGHVWVEVLIGETWVPFDLTYKQYGKIDLSHISFKTSNEIGNLNSVLFEIKSKKSNFDITIDRKFNVLIEDYTLKNQENKSKVSIEFIEEVGPKSYGVITLKLENLKNYYVFEKLNLIVPKEMKIQNTKKNILLKPKEKRELYFPYKLDLLENYKYTLPFDIYKNNIKILSNNIKIENQFKNYKNEFKEIAQKDINQKKENLDFDCDYLFNSSKNINCEIKNLGNTILKNINICYEKKCQLNNLYIGETKKIIFSNNYKNTFFVEVNFSNEYYKYILEEKKLPKIIMSYEKFNNINLEIEYNIENYFKELKIEFILNNKTKILILNNSGKYSYKINTSIINLKQKIFYKNTLILSKIHILDTSFDIFLEIELFLNYLLDKIIGFFKN
jgi:hypothetical protein